MGYYVVVSCTTHIFRSIILCKTMNLNTDDLLLMFLYISYQGLEKQFIECRGMKTQT